jgi:hypothetical protein
VEVAFTRAPVADGKEHLLDEALLDELAHGVVPDNDERVPVLLAVSDNGPQMTSKATAVFMAGARIAQHFGRPGTPNDQAWVESLFGHLKGEHPHLDKIRDPGELEAELDRLRTFYNTVRLHEGISCVTPDDEHTGRGPALPAARRAGLGAAHQAGLCSAANYAKIPRKHPVGGWVIQPPPGAFSQTHLAGQKIRSKNIQLGDPPGAVFGDPISNGVRPCSRFAPPTEQPLKRSPKWTDISPTPKNNARTAKTAVPGDLENCGGKGTRTPDPLTARRATLSPQVDGSRSRIPWSNTTVGRC